MMMIMMVVVVVDGDDDDDVLKVCFGLLFRAGRRRGFMRLWSWETRTQRPITAKVSKSQLTDSGLLITKATFKLFLAHRRFLNFCFSSVRVVYFHSRWLIWPHYWSCYRGNRKFYGLGRILTYHQYLQLSGIKFWGMILQENSVISSCDLLSCE